MAKLMVNGLFLLLSVLGVKKMNSKINVGEYLDKQVKLNNYKSAKQLYQQEILNKKQTSNVTGSLKIIPGTYSKSEIKAAEYMRDLGNEVVLRPPSGTRAINGSTSDLIVNGFNYDVYTPETSNVSRIVGAIAKKNNQAGGIVLDLSNTTVVKSDLNNIFIRVKGVIEKGNKICNIIDIIVLPK